MKPKDAGNMKSINESKFILRIKRMSFWDWLGWATYFYLMVYLFLKMFGFIHSPQSLDAFTYLAIAYYVGKYANKIESMETKMESMETRIGSIGSEVKEINSKLDEHIKDKSLHNIST